MCSIIWYLSSIFLYILPSARFLELPVQIRPWTWMCVCCQRCGLSGRSLSTGCSLVQRSFNDCGMVWWDLETSNMRRPRPEKGCYMIYSYIFMYYILREFSELNSIYSCTSIQFRPHFDPGVESASNRNEYQEYFLGAERPVRWADKLNTFMCILSRNLGASGSWNSQRL